MSILVIFDWKRTLYNPDSKKLIKGAKSLLKSLKAKNIPVILVGKGKEEMQDEVARLEIDAFFKKIIFVENDKNVDIYKPLMSIEKSRQIFFVGDRVRSELEIGNRLGAKTIWIKRGKFAEELPQNKFQNPDFIITSLQECLELLKRFY